MATEKGKEASLDLDLQKRMTREGDRSSDLDSDLDSDLSIEEALEKPKKNKSSAGDRDGESTKMKVEVESGPCEEESESRAESEARFSSESSEQASASVGTARQDEISSGLIDWSLPRANTLPGDKADVDKLEPSSSQLHLERSKTERRTQNNIADEAAQIFDDKISARKKLKMLNRIATVKHDGTVEFNLPSTVEPESLRFGSRDTYNEAVDEEPLDSTDFKYIPPLQIVMLIVGTRGDVQPFIAIGKRLQDYGHRVRLSTHSNFKDFVLTAGLEFFPIGGDPKILAEYMVKNKGFLPSGPSEIPTQRKQMKEIIYSLLSACKDPDAETGIPFKAEAIIANPPAYGHAHVAEALKVPLHIFFTMPWTPTSEFPHPLSRVKQPAGYRLSYQIVDSLIWLGIRDMINDFRKKKLKLRPVTYLSGAQGSASDVPTGYIWSPHLVPKPKDWGPKVDVIGFCFLDLASNYEPPESLVKWIEAGSKPIYIGFGSLPVQEPKKMTQIIVEALEITGQRGIINKGWGGLGQLAEPKDFVYLLDNCPHDWLFLHCMAVVHYGGAGTTAAGLKAACPTTIVPFFGDQPFWGEQVHARGVGPPPIPVDQFSLDKLVSAIRYMLDRNVKQRAVELAAAMEKEDGVTGAVKAFFKHLPPRNPPTEPSPVPTGFFEPCFGSVVEPSAHCSSHFGYKNSTQMDNEICGEDVECINVGTSSGKKPGRRERKNITWSESADEYLADILIEQINLGRKDGTGWTTEGWGEIERKMKEKYGSECVKDKIRNRLRTIKHHYNHIKTLMGLSGFGWDDVTKRVIASDQVWDDYVKAHPDYDYYRGRSVVNYEKFAIIYGDSIADGRDVLLTNQRPPHPMEAPQANIHDVAGESSGSDKMDEAVCEAPHVRKRSTGSSRRNVQDETKNDYGLANAIKDINTTLIYLAVKMAQSGPSQADIVAAIEELDLDLTLEVRALRLLKEPQVASQFLAFSTKDRRRAWLMAELSGSI